MMPHTSLVTTVLQVAVQLKPAQAQPACGGRIGAREHDPENPEALFCVHGPRGVLVGLYDGRVVTVGPERGPRLEEWEGGESQQKSPDRTNSRERGPPPRPRSPAAPSFAENPRLRRRASGSSGCK